MLDVRDSFTALAVLFCNHISSLFYIIFVFCGVFYYCAIMMLVGVINYDDDDDDDTCRPK